MKTRKSVAGAIREAVSGGCRPESSAARPDRAQPLAQAAPRPRLDLLVAHLGLGARRFEVLEPGVGLFDQEQLLRISHVGHRLLRDVTETRLGPVPDGPQAVAGSSA